MGFHRWVGDVDFWVFNIEYSPLKMLPKRFSKKKLPLESHLMITRLAINTTWWNLVKMIALTLCYILLLCTVSPLAVLEFSRAEWSGGDVSRTLTLLERIINVRVKSVW